MKDYNFKIDLEEIISEIRFLLRSNSEKNTIGDSIHNLTKATNLSKTLMCLQAYGLLQLENEDEELEKEEIIQEEIQEAIIALLDELLKYINLLSNAVIDSRCRLAKMEFDKKIINN